MVGDIRNLKLRYGYQWNSHMTNGPDTVAAHKIDLIALLGSIQNYQNKRALVCMLTHEIHWSCHSKIKYPWSCIIFYIPSTKVIIKRVLLGVLGNPGCYCCCCCCCCCCFGGYKMGFLGLLEAKKQHV